MLRALLEYILPLVLPTMVYFVLRGWIAARAAKGQPVEKPAWWDAPWPWLLAAGIALLLATLVALSLLSGADPGASYRPPELRDGEIRPGGFEEPKP